MLKFFKSILAITIPIVLVTPLFLIFASQGNVNLTITNPTPSTQQFDLTLNFPPGLTPAQFSNATWDANTREFVIHGLLFHPNESQVITFQVEGNPGFYTLEGKIVGSLDGKDLLINIHPFTFELKTTGVSVEKQPLQKILENIIAITKEAGNAISKILIGLAAIAFISLALSILPTILDALSRFFTLFPIASYRIDKREPWGRVVNTISHGPVPAAIVSLIETQFKKIKESQLTDREGRFGFLASAGSYLIAVKKRGFETKQTAPIIIKADEVMTPVEILIDPLKEYRARFQIIKILNLFSHILDLFNPVLAVVGTLLAAFLVWVLPTQFNIFILLLYIVLDILKIIVVTITIKSFGHVLDSKSNQPIALAVIRVYDAKNNWLIATKITDTKGRYNILTLPGLYYVTISHKDYEIYQSPLKEITKASIEIGDIPMKPKMSPITPSMASTT